MRALLLAAGYGTRLRPLTDHTPKCLIPIHGRPLLAFWLDLLLRAGVERVLVNTHHLPHKVRSFVAESEWRDRIDLVHEDSLLGTGGTVLRNREFFGDHAFIVAHADNLSRFDVRSFVKRHEARPQGAVITMMTFRTDSPESCGIVVEDDNSVVRELHEKVPNPPGTSANGAVYIFEPVIFEFLSSLRKSVIDISTEVLPHFLGHICTFHNEDYHRDIGSPESLRKAELEFAGT